MDRQFRLAVSSIEHGNPVDSCVAATAEAGRRGADMLLLPEEPDVVGGAKPGLCPLAEHPAFVAFSEAARKARIGLAGSLSAQVETHDGIRPANVGYVLDRDGKLLGTYWKKHPAPTEEYIATDQRDASGASDPFPVFEFAGVRIGMAICLDIHFPEMFRIYGLKGADLVCVPTMYLDYTGDMLEAIEKARAIDSGVYFALSRYIQKPFLAGRSMGYAKVIAPDGRVIVSTGHQDGVAIAEFDPKWRFPFWGEGYGGNLRTMFEVIRRPDLYGELTKPKGD